jgi:hypothetical protein
MFALPFESDDAFSLKEWCWFMNDFEAFDIVAPKSGGWFVLACSDGVLWFNEGQWAAVLDVWGPVVPASADLGWEDEV